MVCCTTLLCGCKESMNTSQLESIVTPHVRVCSCLEPKMAGNLKSPTARTYFGGQPYAESGDSWPSCPTCQMELSFIFQARFSETKYVPPEGVQLFTFFYCWKCSPWGLDDEDPGQWVVRFYSAPSDERAVRIQRETKDEYETTPCSVEIESAKSLPDWEGIDVYCPEASTLSAKLNDDEPWEPYSALVQQITGRDDYATMIGGYPRWVQSESTPKCFQCNQLMEQFAQIDSEDEAGLMWGDVGCVYLFCCRRHSSEIRFELQCH